MAGSFSIVAARGESDDHLVLLMIEIATMVSAGEGPSTAY